MSYIRTAGAGFLLAMLVAACSSSNDDSGAGAIDMTLCQQACQQGADMGCYPASTCPADCERTIARYTPCAAEVNALFHCQVSGGGQLVCSPGAPVRIDGCDAESKAVSLCGACQTLPENGPCDNCRKQSCCAELQAFVSAPDLSEYSACIQTCQTEACLLDCESKHPTAGQAFKSVDTCMTTQCPGACKGEITAGGPHDSVGRYCEKTAGCGMTREECAKTFGGASSSGTFGECGAAMVNALTCVAEKGFQCENDVVKSPECESELNACLEKQSGGGPTCGGTVDPSGECSHGCETWGFRCDAQNACECTTGPNIGLKFNPTAPGCNQAQGQAYCAG